MVNRPTTYMFILILGPNFSSMFTFELGNRLCFLLAEELIVLKVEHLYHFELLMLLTLLLSNLLFDLCNLSQGLLNKSMETRTQEST